MTGPAHRPTHRRAHRRAPWLRAALLPGTAAFLAACAVWSAQKFTLITALLCAAHHGRLIG